jgi:hypothetical protein
MRWVRLHVLLSATLISGAGILLSGCDSTSEYTTVNDRQAQALHDPMNYSVNMDDADMTGGGTSNYDANAMKRDVDDFWNP